MINKERLNQVLELYKRDFPNPQWPEERFKWAAVKHFRDNWDSNAPDFAQMLTRALAETHELLAAQNYFPARMITLFAQRAPEEVRGMFIRLYDEGRDVWERINEFKMSASVLLKSFGDGARQHFQREKAITTYLWLRYPDKYYVFKFVEGKTVANVLESGYQFKKGAYAVNVRNLFALYDEINLEVKRDEELVRLLREHIDDKCYPDPELKTLTNDVCFYINIYYPQGGRKQPEPEAWIPQGYDPALKKEDWLALLRDRTVFTANSLAVMKRIKDFGGTATCKQLSMKYGENVNFYNNNASSLAERVANKMGIPAVDIYPGEKRWWPILFLGRSVDRDTQGVFAWRLRDELLEALDDVDLEEIPLYAQPAASEEAKPGYWWLNANPRIWSFAELAVGETQSYTLFNENGNKRRIFQNFLDTKAGDMVIGYESYPVKKVVALARISAASDGEKVLFEKLESLTTPIDYQALKACPELEGMEYFQNPQGSLFKLTCDEYDFILDLIREENPLPQEQPSEAYTQEDFLNEVYMTPDQYKDLAAVLRSKKNIILQGAPGVGKTFAARRLAYSMMGRRDDSRIELVQFHQSYSYEDFMLGYKPSGEGFELQYGVFYRFCQRAANRPDKEFFFIIDEINRGNLSRIFGELLMLIEKDYRGTKATLAYNDLPFSVPGNVYIIGMMNTADRSLAMIDYALRRRFSFFEMEPGFDSEQFISYQKGLNSKTLDELIFRVKELNQEIILDKSLGKGFCIGHSFFCGRDVCTDEWLHEIVHYDILPTLSEYWFDDEAKFRKWENILRGVLNDKG